ncbi:MAG: helix-turn-helix transcriptional regulator [Clostridia bacterium]|nr:helix-turn-helix transcriptional regulator [Clostridia bacterium]
MEKKCNKQEHNSALEQVQAEMLKTDDIERVCRLFHLLSDPGRFKILQGLLGGEMCVYHLLEICGGTASGVSHQLRILRDNGLVKARRLGKNVEYSIADEHIRKMIEIGVEHLGCVEEKR